MQIAHYQYQTLYSPSIIRFYVFSSILRLILWSPISLPPPVLAASAAMCSAAPWRKCKNLIRRWDFCLRKIVSNQHYLTWPFLLTLNTLPCLTFASPCCTNTFYFSIFLRLFIHVQCLSVVDIPCSPISCFLSFFPSLRPFVFKWRLNTNATCMPVFRHHVGLSQASPPNEWLL